MKARPEARGIKALKKQMVWLQNDGLLGFPIQIYSFTLGFQRASSCGRPFEARFVLFFHVYRNPFVKARGIIALKTKTNGLDPK